MRSKKASLIPLALALLLASCGGGGQGAATAAFSVGGTLAGLAAGQTVILANNVTDTVVLTASGAFRFGARIAADGAYAVTVIKQPQGQVCTVSAGSGVHISTDITTVGVTCTTETYAVGGTISGLLANQQVTLLNNNSAPLTLTANGAFQFSTPIAYGGGYQVTVGAQPSNELCTVTKGSGSGVNSMVSSVEVVCTLDSYSVAVTLSGLAVGQQVTLYDNASDPLSLSQNGRAVFSTLIPFGGSYSVTIHTQPATQTCSVSQGSGTAVSAAVTDVVVQCVPLVVNAWGDSLTAGAGTSNGPIDGYTGQLARAQGYPVNNYGIGGQTSAQIGGRQGGVAVHMSLANNQIGQPSGDVVTFIDNAFLSTAATTQTFTASGYLGAVHGLVSRSVVANAESYLFQADSGTVLQSLPAASLFVPDQQSTYLQGNVIWVGRNDGGLPNGVAQNIASMVSKISSGEYIVMSIINAYNEPTGSSAYNSIVAENNAMATVYGSHYLDIRSVLVSAYDPSISQDVIDHANDVIPQSLHAQGDVIHLNETGYGIVAKAVAKKITALGW
jgi:lysophospholipase L1-like esterase